MLFNYTYYKYKYFLLYSLSHKVRLFLFYFGSRSGLSFEASGTSNSVSRPQIASRNDVSIFY